MWRFIPFAFFAASSVFAQHSPSLALKTLYDARKWVELADALQKTKGHYDLYRREALVGACSVC